MGRFIPIFIIVCLLLCVAALAWPMFMEQPRPAPLSQLNTLLRKTSIGQHAASVLGVSDESNIFRLTPEGIVQTVSQQIQNRSTDVIITHVSRLIIEKFSQLPQDQQQKILESLSTALSQTENLPQASQSSTQTNNNASQN